VPGQRATHWGWHRLADPFARQLVREAEVRPGDLVVDVGAGDGALVVPLLAAGARVVAVELHPRRAAELRRRFAGAPVVVVQCDAADLRLPRRPFRVVANPPFAAIAGVLRRLVSPRSRMLSADLVVPRHVAARWASPTAPGAGRWQQHYEAAVGRSVPPSAFRPAATEPIRCLHIRATQLTRKMQPSRAS
jgi:23S rRNA (adenine-N6)-dimethyltransferase